MGGILDEKGALFRGTFGGVVLQMEGKVWRVYGTGVSVIPRTEESAAEEEAVHRFIDRLTANLLMHAGMIEKPRGTVE